MPGTVKSELLTYADRSHKCDSQEKVCWMLYLPLDKSHFITEITESASVYGQKVVKVAERLLQSGFKLHIDDFGSGYSSMESLSRLPFSVLKIDKSLIDHIYETRVEILVNHIIKLSKDLNMRVLAEGVETKEQLDILRKIKCDEIQGFYYARPMPEVEFVEYVRRKR